MDKQESPVYDGKEFLDRIFKGESETRLLATDGEVEVLKQTIPGGKEWRIESSEEVEGLEFFFILDGRIIHTDPGPERVLGPGDYVSRTGAPEENLWFRTKTDSTLLWLASEPVFRLMQESIDSFKEKAVELEKLEGMKNHSTNLERLSVRLARKMGLSSRQVFNIHYAAYFHDLGKAKVPEEILRKEGDLSESEWATMKKHPRWGREMLEEKEFLTDAAEIVEETHEWVNGEGYPQGLEGNEISLEARIIGVVDAYDAMTTDRIYRDKMSKSEAIAELRENTGTQFDKNVVESFIDMIEDSPGDSDTGEEVSFDRDRAYLQQRKYFLDLGEKVLSKANVSEMLSDLARAVIKSSPFQRAIISLYDRSIDPESPRNTRVVHFSYAGLSPENRERVKELGNEEPEVNLSKFDSNYRISNSYYIPHGAKLESNAKFRPKITSDKSVEEMVDWHPDDKLYVPLTKGKRIMGHISVDDPVDGKAPTAEKLQIIEGLANLGSLAITKTQRIKELNEQKGKLQALHSVGYSFVRANSLEELSRKTTELIGKYFNYEYCTILLKRDGELESVARASELEGKKPMTEGERINFGEGITGWVADNRDPVVANKVEEEPRYIKGREDINSEMAVPVEFGEELLGVLDIQSKTNEDFGDDDLELLETIAAQLAIAISNIKRERELKEQATKDPLTGVYNRRYFSSVIEDEIERSHRYNHTLALMMTDINHFKEVNDSYSHLVGDKVLIEIAELLQKKTRDADTVVRYGGDEFLILFPETGKEVRTVIDRIKSGLSSWNRENDLIDIDLTLASGLSFWFPDGGKDITEAVKQADKRMYQEKGRNVD